MGVAADLQGLIETLQGAVKDAEKHEKGVYAAGTRLRKALQDCTNGCKDLRAKVQNERS